MPHQTISLEQAERLCTQVLVNNGACADHANSVARAIVRAEAEGIHNVGLSHLSDYRSGLQKGRINGRATPFWRETQGMVVEGDGGFAHSAYEFGEPRFLAELKKQPVSALAIRNVFTCGVVGYFVERLARAGYVALAFANSPAVMAPWQGKGAFFGTNPMAFACPQIGDEVLVIDQSSSCTAFVNIRQAAEQGRSLPDGLALDATGEPTNNPHSALNGGTLTPSGGHKGNNLALMVDILAASLCGANCSFQAPSFTEGSSPLNMGQFFIAINPDAFGSEFLRHVSTLLTTYATEHDGYIAGANRQERYRKAKTEGITISKSLLKKVEYWALEVSERA